MLIGCNFKDSNLVRTNFCNARLNGSNLQRANLTEADLKDSKLDGIKAEDANFSKASLNNASINPLPYPAWGKAEASLNGSFLYGTDLSNTKLEMVQLASAKIDDHTNFADSNWWKAQFFEGRHFVSKEIDNKLLNQLFDKCGLNKNIKVEDVHESVQKFIETKPDILKRNNQKEKKEVKQ